MSCLNRSVLSELKCIAKIPVLQKLKDSVTLRFNDSVDFSRYEDGIRQLLNTYVHAEDAKTLIEPLDITNKEKMQEQLARLGSDEAKAEAIQTRQVEVLESQRYVDPIRYMTFMERINKTLQDYQEKRNGEKYLSAMEKMAEDYRTGRSSVEYPENIVDDGDAKSFYGAVCAGIKKSLDGQEVEPPNRWVAGAGHQSNHCGPCETRLAGQCDRPQEHEKGIGRFAV